MIQQIIDQVFLYDEDEENVEDYHYRGMLAGLDDPIPFTTQKRIIR